MSLLVDDPILQQSFVTDPSGHGQQIAYYAGFKCACGNTPDANRARITCTNCFGIGYFYSASPVTLDAVVSQVHMQKSLVDTGLAEPGDLTVTLAPYAPVFMKDYDMIRLTIGSGEPYEGDVLARGALGTVAGNPNSDLLSYEAVTAERCFSINPQTQAVIDYAEGTDFTISGRIITWKTSLTTGTVYSIRYTCFYDWIAYVSPLERFERNVSLGQKVLLKRRAAVLQAAAASIA